MGDVTRLLSAGVSGNSAAFDALYEMLYAELRRLAHARIRRSGDLTLLDTTSLVHEAFLRFEKNGDFTFRNRDQFMGYAARVMRTVVVDAVRARQAERRGGDVEHVALDDTIADTTPDAMAAQDDEILRVHEALEALASVDERLVQVVEMRYFVGMTETEIAMALGLAVRTVGRDWEKARLFLHASLNPSR